MNASGEKTIWRSAQQFLSEGGHPSKYQPRPTGLNFRAKTPYSLVAVDTCTHWVPIFALYLRK